MVWARYSWSLWGDQDEDGWIGGENNQSTSLKVN